MIHYKFEPEHNRSAAYDDDVLIGECDWKEQDGAWLIVHTEVDSAYGGRGIARKLVDLVVENAEKDGIRIVPVCSYAIKVLGEQK